MCEYSFRNYRQLESQLITIEMTIKKFALIDLKILPLPNKFNL